ncbi:DUF305 domain-containing protein [Nonomuraea africana]|uniref:Uncharacterized protein (DUF305 family) n=1 Tax=Nonomuraea africana TaxID=46171 RepID=A0ABR9KG31_9ACTN|nr:DUF305 domain-containing protein [Nonomuraea africana]MBE1560976.1 uncharacterized protein (DUF305 family) [Nonomuraea africana]
MTTLTLAGCSAGPQGPSPVGPGAPVIVPGGPGEAGRTAGPGESLPTRDWTAVAADVRFAEGMIPHHRQALEMAGLVDARTTTKSVRAVARQITLTQQPEITLMSDWLDGLGRAVPDHSSHGGGDGYGMASLEEMNRLRAARGAAFDRLFLELMIRHHEGARRMAREELSGGRDQTMRLMADDVFAGQGIEIARMRELLTP